MKGSVLLQILGGLVIGLALGLSIAWVIAPVQYTDTSPASMRNEFKDQFRAAIASAFNATQNIDRARARLSLLGDPDPAQALVSQAQRMMAAGNSPDSAYELAVLVNALNAVTYASVTETIPAPTRTSDIGSEPTSTQTPFGLVSTLKASSTPGPSPTFRPTTTQKPTWTATPTQGAPFVLVTREEVCDLTLQPRMLMVEVRNKKRQPIPGQKLIINWSGGEESFFTGLKPEISDGYADFQMQPEWVYSLRVATGGETASGLSAPLCTNKDNEDYPGGIKIIFQQP
jgi:hypothetical protein